jgi:methanogenic corrinoid protein MtbC1
MNQLLSQYLDPLLRGRRKDCRDIVKSALAEGIAPKHLYHDVLWPAMARVDQMYRGDQINVAAEHMATRINRTVADHLQTRLDRKPAINRCILITSAEGEAEEFSAQMCSDLFEAEGWDVFLVGGGVPQDEIVELVGQIRPDILLVVGSRPQDAPGVRALIEAVHQINACPTMNVMVSGGVFNRAGELWKEVKADLFAATAGEALELALEATPRTPQSIDPNAPKKRRRRRRPALLLATEGHA